MWNVGVKHLVTENLWESDLPSQRTLPVASFVWEEVCTLQNVHMQDCTIIHLCFNRHLRLKMWWIPNLADLVIKSFCCLVSGSLEIFWRDPTIEVLSTRHDIHRPINLYQSHWKNGARSKWNYHKHKQDILTLIYTRIKYSITTTVSIMYVL